MLERLADRLGLLKETPPDEIMGDGPECPECGEVGHGMEVERNDDYIGWVCPNDHAWLTAKGDNSDQ